MWKGGDVVETIREGMSITERSWESQKGCMGRLSGWKKGQVCMLVFRIHDRKWGEAITFVCAEHESTGRGWDLKKEENIWNNSWRTDKKPEKQSSMQELGSTEASVERLAFIYSGLDLQAGMDLTSREFQLPCGGTNRADDWNPARSICDMCVAKRQ